MEFYNSTLLYTLFNLILKQFYDHFIAILCQICVASKWQDHDPEAYGISFSALGTSPPKGP